MASSTIPKHIELLPSQSGYAILVDGQDIGMWVARESLELDNRVNSIPSLRVTLMADRISVIIDPDFTPRFPERSTASCSAHGTVACEGCSRSRRASSVDENDNCRECASYKRTGMHYDSCPERIA